MDIYTPDGDLDPEKAQRELVAIRQIIHAGEKKTRQIELQIATLLDIASSLRTVALEASFAMQSAGVLELNLSAEPEDTPDDSTRDFLVVGDLVVVEGQTEPGEVVGLGFDQGDPYAVVDYADTKGARYYTRNLTRLIGDAGPAVTTQRPEDGLGLVGTVGVDDVVEALRDDRAELAALNAEADGEPDFNEADLVKLDDVADDIDADFGDEPHPAAEDALAVLKANEAARKAGKKKGSKK